MRIGIDCRTIFASHRGFRRLTRLLQALGQIDPTHEYRLFTTDEKAFDELELPGNFSREDPHRRFRMLHRGWARLYGKLAFRDISAFHFPTADVWYAHFAPTVVTLHDLAQWHHPDRFFTDMETERRYWSHLEQIGQNADVVATVSHYVAREIAERLRWPREKLAVVYQGYPELCGLPRSRAREEYLLRRFECSPGFILYAGGLDFRKNVESLIRAYHHFRENSSLTTGGKELVIVGELDRDNPRMYPDLEEIVAEEGLTAHVRFTGYLSDNDLAAMYRLAGVFAFPSICEGFGYAPLEAMSCELPVVCSSATALPETVGKAALLVEPFDLEAWAESLEQVLTDQDLRDRLVREGLKNLQRFDWQETARGFLQLYERVADAP